jgi:hypothetical protein
MGDRGLENCRSQVVTGRNFALNCAEAISKSLIQRRFTAYSE